MNRVKVGFFSLSGSSASGDDRPYLRWHLFDHMPQQYEIPGLLLGSRWGWTPACHEARAVDADDLRPVRYVVQYLMTDPVQQTLDDFVQLGRRLAEAGRYPERVTSHLLGAFHLVDAQAAPRALVSAEVIPFRPHLGVYVIVEQLTASDGLDRWRQWLHAEHHPQLLAVPGVAGVWSYATSALWTHPAWTPGEHCITVCYLDGDPALVGEGMRSAVQTRWQRSAPVRPMLASPFVSMMAWDWERFGPPAR